MTRKIEGIIPVMLTPFTEEGEIDYPGLERLIQWYLDKGADALFAIAQSSEMQFLTLAERAALGHFVVKQLPDAYLSLFQVISATTRSVRSKS